LLRLLGEKQFGHVAFGSGLGALDGPRSPGAG
jgi:hypothetical protein